MKKIGKGPVKVGIAGIGRAGWGMHCVELDKRKDKYIIVAACDVDASRLPKIRERYGCKTYSSLAEMVKDPEVEVVAVATRSPEHVEHALKALKAGKIVFLEKPIALTYKDALRLKAASKKYRNKLYFRHNRRFEPGFTHIREIIASGILGEIHQVKLRRNGYSRRDDWQSLIKCGGGQLNNWGPHIIDHSLQFLGSPVAEIWSDIKKIAAAGDAEDHLKIVLKGRNGRIVDMEISGGAAVYEPEYIVLGTKGGLTCSGNEIKLRYLDPSVKLSPRKPIAVSPPMDGGFGSPDNLVWKEETVQVAPKAACDMDHIWDHLFASIRQGKKFPITIDEGVEVVRVVDQVKKGTKFGKRAG